MRSTGSAKCPVAVDSEAATKLTIATFDRLNADPKIGRAEALRQAMLFYLNDASSPKNAYPPSGERLP